MSSVRNVFILSSWTTDRSSGCRIPDRTFFSPHNCEGMIQWHGWDGYRFLIICERIWFYAEVLRVSKILLGFCAHCFDSHICIFSYTCHCLFALGILTHVSFSLIHNENYHSHSNVSLNEITSMPCGSICLINRIPVLTKIRQEVSFRRSHWCPPQSFHNKTINSNLNDFQREFQC
jgi:hypothetical protein